MSEVTKASLKKSNREELENELKEVTKAQKKYLPCEMETTLPIIWNCTRPEMFV